MKQFLNSTSASGPIDYTAIIEYLGFKDFIGRGHESEFHNIAQIKFPGIEWFSVMDIGKKIVQIGSILAKTRKEGYPLDIVKFFNVDPNIILLYAENNPFNFVINGNNLEAIISMLPVDIVKFFNVDPNIILLYAENNPFNFVINGNNLEAIISMLPGNSFHRLESITSKTYTLEEIIHWFMRLKLKKVSKMFYISNIYAKNVAAKKVIIFVNNQYPFSPEAFYSIDNELYFLIKYSSEKSAVCKITDISKKNPELGRVIKERYNERTDFIIEKAFDWGFYKTELSSPLLPLEITREKIENIEAILQKKLQQGKKKIEMYED